jgi:DNA-binding transcriptional LysR family regulator
MAKAATQLGLTQPAVSDIIAGLEQIFSAPLFDRNPRGVEPTAYGKALLRRGRAAFDEIKQGIRDIEFLSDPTAGELRIGCPASVVASVLSLAIERFSTQYPRVVVQFDEVTSPGREFPSLLDRTHDLVLARIAPPLVGEDDLDIEVLYQDPLVIVADAQSHWARRRKIKPADLLDASWILTAPNASVYLSVAKAFKEHDLPMPKVSLAALSGLVRMNLLYRGPFVTALPQSMLGSNAARYSLKVLPVDMNIGGYPVAILTLKNRVLSPLISPFLAQIREVAKTVAHRPQIHDL